MHVEVCVYRLTNTQVSYTWTNLRRREAEPYYFFRRENACGGAEGDGVRATRALARGFPRGTPQAGLALGGRGGWVVAGATRGYHRMWHQMGYLRNKMRLIIQFCAVKQKSFFIYKESNLQS